jgi:hypothetical protein
VPASEIPACDVPTCFQSACQAIQWPSDTPPACIGGRCIAGFECDWSLVSCDDVPPDCPPGFTSTVKDGCYSLYCVPADECADVRDCNQCSGDLACVQIRAFDVTSHCVTVPDVCTAEDCACFGASVCDETEECLEAEDGIECSCPDC